MKLFKLLFLYFIIFFTGFLCYGDSFKTSLGAANPNLYLNNQSIYYIVPAQKWNNLPDETKTAVFQINPEQMRDFFNAQGLNEKDMVGHYMGSMVHVEEDVMFEKVKTLDEIYTNMGIENNVFKEVYNNGIVVKPFIAGSSIEDITQRQWEGSQNWGMNIKVMGKKEPKMIEALSFDADVVNSISAQGIMDKAIGLEDIGAGAFYVVNATMGATPEIAGKMIFIKNNTDYVKAAIREEGLGIDMTIPHQNLEFYVSEPIGGGGGGTALAKMEVDVQNYVNAELIRATGVSDWQEVLGQRQIQKKINPAIWIVVPSEDIFTYRGYE